MKITLPSPQAHSERTTTTPDSVLTTGVGKGKGPAIHSPIYLPRGVITQHTPTPSKDTKSDTLLRDGRVTANIPAVFNPTISKDMTVAEHTANYLFNWHNILNLTHDESIWTHLNPNSTFGEVTMAYNTIKHIRSELGKALNQVADVKKYIEDMDLKFSSRNPTYVDDVIRATVPGTEKMPEGSVLVHDVMTIGDYLESLGKAYPGAQLDLEETLRREERAFLEANKDDSYVVVDGVRLNPGAFSRGDVTGDDDDDDDFDPRVPEELAKLPPGDIGPVIFDKEGGLTNLMVREQLLREVKPLRVIGPYGTYVLDKASGVYLKDGIPDHSWTTTAHEGEDTDGLCACRSSGNHEQPWFTPPKQGLISNRQPPPLYEDIPWYTPEWKHQMASQQSEGLNRKECYDVAANDGARTHLAQDELVNPMCSTRIIDEEVLRNCELQNGTGIQQPMFRIWSGCPNVEY